MNRASAATLAADPLRAYITTLQKGRNISQEALAVQAGISPRTYTAWARGETKSIKDRVARALIECLGGSLEHYAMLARLSGDEARDLAVAWLELSPEEQDAAKANQSSYRRVIELAEDDPQELEEIIGALRQQAKGDPALLTWLRGYLAGRGAARPRQG